MRICIISRGPTLYSTSRIAEVGRRRRHDVRIVEPTRVVFGVTANGLEISHPMVKLDTMDVVIPRVGASAMQYGLPMVEHFELMGIPVINGADSFRLARNKLLAGLLMSSLGIPTPRTLCLRDPAHIDAAVEVLGGPPVVVKIQPATQGVGVAVCESLRSTRSVVEAFWSMDREVILQEFIAEAAGSDIRTLVVDGRVVAAMRRTSAGEDFRSNLHRGGTAEAVELDRITAEIAVRAADAMELLVAGVDIIESRRGPLVMEVNPSPGLQGIEEATAVDVAGAVIRCAERIAREG